MKKMLMFFAIIYLFVGCKVKRMLPDNYEIIEDNFCNGNYRKVVELLNSPDIKHKEKTDWYYFFYGFSIYKIEQCNSQEALKYIKIANSYNNEDFNITFSLGEISFDVGKYKQASSYFEKCVTKNLGKSKAINNHPVLWLLLSKLKIEDLNLDKFSELYDTDESEELKNFILILKRHTLQIDDILYFIQSNELSDREKLLVIDVLLEIEQNKKQIFEVLYSFDLPELFKEYFGSRLLYYKLGNLDECFSFIQELNCSGSEAFIILKSREYMVWEYFDKYCAFYYWLKKDYLRANSLAQSYYYEKKRINSYSIKSSEDLKLFYKEFKNDREFVEIVRLQK